MAVVKRTGASSSTKTEKEEAPKRSKLQLSLPTEERVPSNKVQDYSYLFYGRKGIGKTTLACEFPDVYLLALEPGDTGLRVKSMRVPDWEHYVGYIDLLVKKNDPSITVVVDVIDLAYDYIYDKTCKDQLIDSPTEENDFGATWRRIRKAFRQQFQRILSLPGGKVFLSHDQEKTFETRHGEVERVQPTMSKQALAEVEGLVDFVGFYEYDDEDRVMHIRGSQVMVAKCRFKERFLIAGGSPGVGADQVKSIPMGESSQEAYTNFVRAFKNKQETVDGKAPPKAKKKLKLSST